MEQESERLERRQLETLSTAELIRHALEESRLLVKAEVLHAKKELREEFKAARTAGVLMGAAGVLALVGLVLLFVTVALALPLAGWLGALLVGLALLVVAGGLGYAGFKRVPKQPLAHTQERLREDLQRTRETLQ